MRIAKPALDSRSSLIQISEFSKNFGDIHEIMKFEKAREVLGSTSCLRLLGSGFKVLGSKKAQRKKLKADRPEQRLVGVWDAGRF